MKDYFELPGDGGSDVIGQVTERRERIALNLAPLRRLLAVGSGKGGVGKSTLTMLLALGLQARGLRPAILDADFNGPTQARLGGLEARPPVPGPAGLVVPRSVSGLGLLSFGALFPEPQAVDFPSRASGDSYVWRATREFSILGEILGGADWRPYDTLLLDLPPGSERTLQFAEFLDPRVRFILVTLPSELSRGVVARSVSALSRSRGTVLGYIENMSGYYCPGCRAIRPLFPSSKGEGLPLRRLGSVPFDPELAAACDRGLQHSDLSRLGCGESIGAMCRSLLDLLEAPK
jgi:ATP-binding protein involved in chromosome partitioning